MLIKIIVLVGLTQLLSVTHKPLLCAGLYTAVGLLMGLMFFAGGHGSIFLLAIGAVIHFVLASLYFWLLSRFDSGLAYWAILVLGLFIGLV